MKDLKAFMARVEGDSKLAKKLEAAATAEEVVAIAADAGYTFTADDLMDAQMEQVAGGKIDWRGGLNWLKQNVGEPIKGAAEEVGKNALNAAAKTGVGYINQAGQKLQNIGSSTSNIQ